jgi:hypothetical protein
VGRDYRHPLGPDRGDIGLDCGDQTTEKAAGSANSYRALEQDARMFLRIDLSNLSVEEARDVLQKLVV